VHVNTLPLQSNGILEKVTPIFTLLFDAALIVKARAAGIGTH